MAWRDILVQLRGELADVRARRQRQYEADQVEIQRQRDQLSRMARDLGIVDLIKEMNDILLEGRGELEHIVSWEPVPDHHIADDPESMLDEDVEVEADVITDILTWEEGGELELAVDLGIGDDRRVPAGKRRGYSYRTGSFGTSIDRRFPGRVEPVSLSNLSPQISK